MSRSVKTILIILSLIKERGAENVSSLSKELGITRRSVQRHLSTLEDFDLIRYDRGYSLGGKQGKIEGKVYYE